MKKKILTTLFLSVTLLASFNIAYGADIGFTDNELESGETNLFYDGYCTDTENLSLETDKQYEPTTEVIKIGDNVNATITYIYQDFDDYMEKCKVPTDVVISGTGATWDYLDDGFDNENGVYKNPFQQPIFHNGWYTPYLQITIEDGITKIGDRLFDRCYFKNISIPDSVSLIGKYSFRNVNFANNVILPNSISKIGQGAFYESKFHPGCELIIQKSIRNISEYAFYNCNGLRLFDFDDVNKIGMEAFSGTELTVANIPNGISTIENKAFSKCMSLKTVTLPNSLKEIKDEAFDLCINLESISIPNSVEKIGNKAFGSCAKLTSIEIPDSVKLIGDRAFASCISLTDIKIPNNELVLLRTFEYCKNLNTVIIPKNVKLLQGTFANCNVLSNVTVNGKQTKLVSTFSNCARLKTIKGVPGSYAESYAKKCKVKFELIANTSPEIGDTLEIGDFRYKVTSKTSVQLTGVTKKTAKVSIPNTITIGDTKFNVISIGNNAFYGDTVISSISIGKNVTSIGSKAFYGCKKLSKITLPVNVKKIGSNAFRNSQSLKYIKISGTKLSSVGTYAFYANKTAKIYVPKDKYTIYKKLIDKSKINKGQKYVKF